jgi:uncharacterized protein YjbI with pentapeptide repeats
MDRNQALRLLKGGPEGIAEWNRRRARDDDIPSLLDADLAGADLSEVDLSAANLRGANLHGTDLRAATLHSADLSEAQLTGADLSRADLSRAILSAANLYAANLSGANLGGAILREANLNTADLIEANLVRADLLGASLGAANLRRANLKHASLRWATLCAADLSEAQLTGADLSRADLRGAVLSASTLCAATLSGANLGGADFARAICDSTTFAGVDLSAVSGLESADHRAPSTVGTDTLFRSIGRIPEAFLRGCGVPEALIQQLPSIIRSMEPAQIYSCFISYSNKDEDFANRLHSRMVEEKLRVWLAPEEVPGGEERHDKIDEVIRLYDKLLIVLSPASMGSEWVKTEVRKARRAEIRENKRKLIPIALVEFDAIRNWECFNADSGMDVDVEIRQSRILDFSKWQDHEFFEEAFDRLIASLAAEDSTGSPAHPSIPPEMPR